MKHEKHNGEFAEHKGLKVTKGKWVMGLQVQYNPFTKSNIRIFDQITILE